MLTDAQIHPHKHTHTHTDPKAHSVQTLRARTQLMKPRTKTAHRLCEKQTVGKQISGALLGRPRLPFCHVQPQNRHPPPLVPTQHVPPKHQPLDEHTDTHSHTHNSIYYSLKRSPFSLAKRPVLLIILCINKWQICAT